MCTKIKASDANNIIICSELYIYQIQNFILSRKVEGRMRGHENVGICGPPVPTSDLESPVFKAHYMWHTDGEVDLKPYFNNNSYR